MTSSRIKSHGVVYTPPKIAGLILDRVGFRAEASLDKRLIDPSCGDGAFLVPAALRTAKSSIDKNHSDQQTRKTLEDLIWGAELDPAAAKACRLNLDQAVGRFGISGVNWNIRVGDSLARSSTWFREQRASFDAIVGNPPYVRIQNLGEERRRRVQRDWSVCSRGSTDLFLAFFELGMALVRKGGKVGFITPRSYFSSEAGKDLRTLLLKNQGLSEIIDFDSHQVFEEVTTYTAITIWDSNPHPGAEHQVLIEKRDGNGVSLEKEKARASEISSNNGRWIIKTSSERKFVEQCENRGPTLGDRTSIRVGLATLADRIYVLREIEARESEGTNLVRTNAGEELEIESDLLRSIVKVSRLTESDLDQGLRIIFPYTGNSADHLRLLQEEEFRQRYPKGYSYLLSNKEALGKRGHATSTWYEFGSSQGIRTCFGEKILLPPMAPSPKLIPWTRDDFTFYSGYGMYFEGDKRALAARLMEDDFARYVKSVGRVYRGNYIAITKRVIENFSLSPDEWDDLGAQGPRQTEFAVIRQ